MTYKPNNRVLVHFSDTDEWIPASVMRDEGHAYVLVHLDHSRSTSLPSMAGSRPLMMVRKALVKPLPDEPK